MDRFIDDIGVIRIGNGLVRIQTVRRVQKEGGDQLLQERGDLVVPITTFLSMYSGFTKAIDQMVERGILRKREDAKIEKTDAADSSESDVVDTQVDE
jgi:hypothetical protein